MKVGVIGSGAISGIYLKNMIERFDNLEVIAIADRRGVGAGEKAKAYGIEAVTVEALLSHPEVEMIVNLTPVGTHYDLIKSALLAGKHVYTEKTLTSDPVQAKELLDLADENGLYLGSAPDTFMGSALQSARQAIDDGIIGEVNSFAISVNRSNSFLISLFPFLKQPGAGVLFDYAVYHMTALVSLFGPVAKVGAIVRAPYKTHININPKSSEYGETMQTPNESQVSAIVQLHNGMTGTLHLNTESNRDEETFFAVYGTKGILYLTDPNLFGGSVQFIPDQSVLDISVEPVNLWQFTPFSDNSRGLGPSEMAEAIIEGRPNRASKEMAYHVLEVLDAILKCGEKGAFQTIESTFTRPLPLEGKRVPITNIGHISVRMANESQMLKFYSEVLEMKPLFELSLKEIHPAIADEENRPCLAYFKLANHQYLELLYNNGASYETVNDRREHYGYMKVNFEVEDIEAFKSHLIAKGVTLVEDIHVVVDGSKELTILDPDGNEIQFTEYAKGAHAKIKLSAKKAHESCSKVSHTTQVAFQVKDPVNMLNFYVKGLGLNKALTLTYNDLYLDLENKLKLANIDTKNELASQIEPIQAEMKAIERLRDRAWIDFIEIAPHQYLELFHSPNEVKKAPKDVERCYGYNHLCLEVDDIEAAYKAVIYNGIKPDTEITLGAEGVYQFWLTDPDGNRVELMAYTEKAMQLS